MYPSCVTSWIIGVALPSERLRPVTTLRRECLSSPIWSCPPVGERRSPLSLIRQHPDGGWFVEKGSSYDSHPYGPVSDRWSFVVSWRGRCGCTCTDDRGSVVVPAPRFPPGNERIRTDLDGPQGTLPVGLSGAEGPRRRYRGRITANRRVTGSSPVGGALSPRSHGLGLLLCARQLTGDPPETPRKVRDSRRTRTAPELRPARQLLPYPAPSGRSSCPESLTPSSDPPGPRQHWREALPCPSASVLSYARERDS